MAVEKKNASVTKSTGHRGFTLLQMLIVVVVIAVIGGMAAYGIAGARQRIRLTNPPACSQTIWKKPELIQFAGIQQRC